MSKELVIAANRHEIKVAILEDDQLVEVFFQRSNEYSLAGSIHKGRVTRVLPGMQSAFVDLGLERDTFLYVSDFSEEGERLRPRFGEPRAARRLPPERPSRSRELRDVRRGARSIRRCCRTSERRPLLSRRLERIRSRRASGSRRGSRRRRGGDRGRRSRRRRGSRPGIPRFQVRFFRDVAGSAADSRRYAPTRARSDAPAAPEIALLPGTRPERRPSPNRGPSAGPTTSPFSPVNPSPNTRAPAFSRWTKQKKRDSRFPGSR